MRGKKPGKSKAQKRADSTRSLIIGEAVEDYRHAQDTRKNIPSSGQADFDTAPVEKKTYAYDPHFDPQLVWAGKAEHTSFDVDTVSLHIHERISTQAILRAARSKAVQRTLFNDTDSLRPSERIEFYKHDMGWTNRLILGDSLVVMNSLVEKENLAGRVQCIYIDPPYGVKFNSNFQPSIARRDVRDGDDASLTREPEQIQAYRDTWALGIHSYLTYLRDRLLLARGLLTESGSIFVQISDENLHHVRELLDEVFGAGNFVGIIAFRKTAGLGASALSSVADFILWYAKDASAVKTRKLFIPRGLEDDVGNRYTRVQLSDGTRRVMTSEEREDPARLPKGARVYRHDNLTSQRPAGGSDVREYEFDGKVFTPGKGTFKTDKPGLDRLAAARRLAYPTPNSLAYVRFLDDFPFTELSNVWTDTQTGAFTDEKVYVVQTNVKVIERCILMASDPGDLVLDPTCGSGTTALVAEQWGRRWITIDTSRVAVALARQRVLTARFPFYALQNPDLGVRGSFEYERVPHVTLRSIAQGVPEEPVVLHDRPREEEALVRVAGPFTVEAVPKFTLATNGDAAKNTGANVNNLLELLRKDGVTFKGGKKLKFLRLTPSNRGVIHGEGEAEQDGKKIDVAVSIGPLHGPVTPDQVVEGIRDAEGANLVIFVGFSFDPEVYAYMDKKAPKSMRVEFAHAASDILVGDLLKKKRDDQLFTVFGDVDIRLSKSKDGKHQVEVRGLDLYDPTTGEVKSTSNGDTEREVAAWFLDTDYDRETFLVCQAFFPAKGPEAWEKLSKALKAQISEDKWEALSSLTSLPFEAGKHKRIAVKVIDHRGNEIVRVKDLGV